MQKFPLKVWLSPPVPVYTKFYFFNVLNPEEVENGETPEVFFPNLIFFPTRLSYDYNWVITVLSFAFPQDWVICVSGWRIGSIYLQWKEVKSKCVNNEKFDIYNEKFEKFDISNEKFDMYNEKFDIYNEKR